MPDAKTVDRAVALIQKGRTNRIYFFDKLDDPEWISPLKDRGFFSKPPDLVERGRGVMCPAWAESEYLVRMAEVAPDLVAEVLQEIPETENVRVRGDMLRAAAKLDREAAVRISERERSWITSHSSLWLDYPESAASLIIRLAEVGAADEALGMAADLFAVLPTGRTDGWRSVSATRLERWTYGQISAETIPQLAALLGLPALALAADLLQTALELDHRADKPLDYSDVWRPSIEDHAQNVSMDFRDDLVSVIRDAAHTWVGDDRERLSSVVGDLVRRDWIIFRRLALYLLAEKVTIAPDEAIAASLDPVHFFEERVRHEAMSLSQRTFELLSDELKRTWFELLDQGPTWPARDPAKRTDDGISDEDYERYVKIWRRDRLQVIEHQLSEVRAEELAALITEYGRNEHPTFHSYSASWVGPTSPVGDEELAQMSPGQVVEFVRNWKPTGETWSPTPEGLGRLVTKRVASDPAPFSALAAGGVLGELDPTYVRSITRGLEEAVKADRGADINWEGALQLIEVGVRTPQIARPEGVTADDGDWDPDWGWCRKDAAGLLEVAMARQLIPTEFAQRVWAALVDLSWDPEPSPEHEEQYGGSNMDPLTLSINTVRGQAMHAVVQYATWRKLEAEPETIDLGSLPEVADNLAAHLDPVRDPSETTRAVLGSRLAQLQWIDGAWLASTIGAVFPDSEPRLRLAAWETFLVWGRPTEALFKLLGGEYGRAVDGLPTSDDRRARAGKDPGFALAEHFGAYAWWGLLDLETNGMLHRFVRRASPSELGHFLNFIGRSLDTAAIEPEIQGRLMAIWERISEWVEERSPEERNEALASFGWWYGSGRLPPDWSDAQVVRLLEIGVPVDPDFKVAERLTSRAPEDVRAALAVVRAYLSSEPRAWGLYSMRDSFRLVLSLALKSPEVDVARDAEQALHDIGSRGMLEFRDLLPRGSE